MRSAKKNDKPRLVAYVAGIEGQNIVALELYYHRSCYREYTRPNRPCGGIFMLESDAVEQVYEFIYKCVIQEGEVMLTKEFVELYGLKSPEPQKLPPTRDALLCHLKRVSYATAIVKLSLQQFPPVPTPNGCGWELKEGELEIVWMLPKPAPVQILELISCNCRRSKCKNARMPMSGSCFTVH